MLATMGLTHSGGSADLGGQAGGECSRRRSRSVNNGAR
jgi:hypothetical protein